jgi:hypothetical protein
VTDANFAGRKASISAKLGEIVRGKLAKDAKLDELPKVMDAIEEVDAKDEEAEDEEESEAEAEAEAKKKAKDKKRGADKRAKDAEEDKEAEKRKFLENTLSEDEMASYDAMCAGKDAEIEDPDESKEDDEEEKPAVDKGKKAKDKRAKDEEPGEEKVSKAAMDAAIKTATAKATADAIETQRAIRTAEEEVAPFVGKLTMSFDSAEGVYKQALKIRGVDVKGVHPSAFRVLVKNLPPVTKRREGTLAMDAGNADSFKEMFPTAAAVTAV